MLFAVEDFGSMGLYLRAMFAGGASGSVFFYYLASFGPVMLLAGVGSTPLVKKLWTGLHEKPCAAGALVLAAAALVLCTAYLVNTSYNPFLYFRF